MNEGTSPQRDLITIANPEPAETNATISVQASAETPKEKPLGRRNWREFKNVVEYEPVGQVDRLNIVAGVHQYKGNHLVFVAKVTEKDFARSFFSMPAYMWEKALPILQKYVNNIAEIEKKAMEQAVIAELKRLQELGIDVKALINRI